MTQTPETDWLSDCEREQLHRIGAIQPFGLLLAGGPDDDRVRAASADAADWLGLGAGPVLGRALADLVPLSRDDFPPEPGRKRVIAGLIGTARGPLDALLSNTGAGWLLELEPSDADDPCPPIADPLLRQLLQAPATDGDWADYCDTLAAAVRLTSGYERVMVYRFLTDGCGEVIAESTVHQHPRYLGLRFPASDIPKIARDIFRINSHRQIPDIGAAPVPIEVLPGTDPDLSLSDLRAVSPVHLQYLANMAVTASLTIAILVGDSLWGLVACHHGRPRRLSLRVREQCVELAQTYALGLGSFLARQRLRRVSGLDARLEALVELVLDVQSGHSPAALLEPAVLGLVQADGAALLDAQGLHRFGLVPSDDQVHAIDRWFTQQAEHQVLATDRLAADGAVAVDLERAAGVLAVRARSRPTAGVQQRFYWFRGEQARSVNWAGDPRKPVGTAAADGVLNPRHSFDLWIEHTHGHSAPWDDLDLMAARKLRLLLLSSGMRAGARGLRAEG